MSLVVKKKPGDSNSQIINEFNNETRFDPVLESNKEKLQTGHLTPSVIRKQKNKQRANMRSIARKRAARRRGVNKKLK